MAMTLLRLFANSKKLLIALFGVLFITAGTFIAIRWGQGYRPSLGKKGATITGTGLLVTSSDPRGAQVFLNQKLTTATDDTLNLTPGVYDVEIKMDGFTPWHKTITIVAELVTQANAKLFPSVPNLSPLTYSGAQKPVPSPDGQKIVYQVNSASTETKNGLWMLELSDRNLPIARAGDPKQIVRNTSDYNFLDAKLLWVPDSSQILAYWTDVTISKAPVLTIKAAVLLDANGINEPDALRDVTSRLPVLLSQWHTDIDLKDQEKLGKLPEFMQQIATSSAFAYFSPDELRFLYRPAEDTSLPQDLIPDLPSESTQKEERDIKSNKMYVYDIKEDKNFSVGVSSEEPKSIPSLQENTRNAKKSTVVAIPSYWEKRLANLPLAAIMTTAATATLPPVPGNLFIPLLDALRDRYSPIWKESIQWFPTSTHLLKHQDSNSSINIMEYDGGNDVTIYNGSLAESFIYPWPNGSRLVILTKLNDSSPMNLYAIGLK